MIVQSVSFDPIIIVLKYKKKPDNPVPFYPEQIKCPPFLFIHRACFFVYETLLPGI